MKYLKMASQFEMLYQEVLEGCDIVTKVMTSRTKPKDTRMITGKRIWMIIVVVTINHTMMKKIREYWDMIEVTIVVIMVDHAPTTRMNSFFQVAITKKNLFV